MTKVTSIAGLVLSAFMGVVTTLSLEASKDVSVEDQARVIRVTENIQKIINTDEFKLSVTFHQFKGKPGFAHSNGDSNEVILRKILEGTEVHRPEKNFRWDFTYEIKFNFAFWSDTTAVSHPGPLVTIYKSYFKGASDAELARTICHEYMHKLGYYHPSSNKNYRSDSVPYQIGSMCQYFYVSMF